MSVAALVHYATEGQSALALQKDLLPPSLDPHSADIYQVNVPEVGFFLQSPNWPANFTPADGKLVKFELNEVSYRGVWLRNIPIMDDDRPPNAPPLVTVFYAAPITDVQHEVLQEAGFIALASLLLLAITVAVALWGLRRGLDPLNALAAQAAQVSATNWEAVPRVRDEPDEIKPLVQALGDMLDRLRRSFTQQREFIGNAAHELKTPVAILKSTLQTLARKPRTTDEYRAGLVRALEDTERLERLLQWMLRLARAEHLGAGRSDLEMVDLGETCEDAIARVQSLAKMHEVSLQLHRNGPSLLRADPSDLELIWVNLLENAIRYSPENGRVDVHAESVDSKVQVRVVDQGSGIPEEELPHVFDRFHRVDRSRTRDTGGFGLGLSLAKAFTEAYGGNIRLSSKVDQGTSVVVEFPACKN
jgi:signal transduction histidine kinase